MSRASSSRLVGRFRTSVISSGRTVVPPVLVGGRSGPASAELLGQPDDDPGGAAEVAQQVAVLVARHLAEEFGAVGAQAGDDVVDVVDGEHDTVQAQGVRR